MNEGKKRIKVYDWKGSIINNISLPKSCPVFSVNLHNFIWIGSEKTIFLYDPKTLQLVGSFEAHQHDIVSILTVSENIVWTACSDGEICIWEVEGASFKTLGRRLEQSGQTIRALSLWGKNRILSNATDHILFWDALVSKIKKKIDFIWF